MPSSAPDRPRADLEARVLREDLTFRCRKAACNVVATYLVDCDRAASVSLDFLVPVKARVTGRIGAAPGVVTVAAGDSALPALEKRVDLGSHYLVRDERLPPLYRATVSGNLTAGRNQIVFEYEQPLGAKERGHGYFKKGSMEPEFFYLLWPLKEWTRARDFAIDLRVEIDRVPPSWWKRTFGDPADVTCGNEVAGRGEQVGGQLIYRARLGDPFPDALHCRISDWD